MKKTYNLRSLVIVSAVMLGLAAGIVVAETAEESFKSLFGEQIRGVSATAGFADDVKLAGEIVQVASTSELPDKLLTVMYNTAFDLASRSPIGYDVAQKAMTLLSKAVPAQEIKCSQKTLTLSLKRLQKARKTADRKVLAVPYIQDLMRTSNLLARSGNFDLSLTYSRKALATAISFKLSNIADIRTYNSELMVRRSAAKRRELLEKKLKADPDDVDSRKKLIEIYLVDLDDPAAAGKLVNADCDEMLQTYVALAVKPITELKVSTLGEIGAWYLQFADKATGSPKVAMLRRTEGYYLRFLEVYTAKDAKRLKVMLGLASVRRKLAKLGQSAGHGAPIGTSAGPWPCSTKGLVFIWGHSTWASSSVGTAGVIARASKLTPRGKARVTTGKSISLKGGAFLAAPAINGKLLAACMKSNALTIEALIKPDDLDQSGPARIISFSQDGQIRNFTVGQEKNILIFRLRTTSKSDQNTSIPLLKLTAGRWHHVVITYQLVKDASSGKTSGKVSAYLNGKPARTINAKKGGQLSGWASMHLLFGDEFADKRDWAGELKGISIYSRAISAKEAAAKYNALRMAATPKK
ncbi:MAG: LamG domain-containing protein [Phycisphaerae bacterium]|jgi:hypothetical protein|nr:LamG domain-containing protein [Phycisphaerae bacterium]